MSSDEVSLAIEVDADDAISSLEEYVKMLEEVEKASDIDLDGITDALEGAGEGADSAIKPMEGLTDAFDNVVSTAEGASSSIESIVASFESGTSASEGLVSAVTEAGSGFEEFSGSAETGTGSLEALVASFEEGTAASETLNSGIAELPPVIDETASASTSLSTELENTGSLFTETSASATDTAGALTETNSAFTETATAATDTGTALTDMTTTTVDLGASVAELAPAVTDASTGFADLTTATTDTATGMVDIATETTNVATEMTSLAPAITEGASAFKTLETNMGASVGFFGQAASGAIGLVRQFTSLNNLQTRVAFTENRLSTFRENLGKATDKLTKLQASGTASAKDLAAAQLDVEQAEQKVDIQTQRVEQSQENLNIAMADFYLTIGPNIIQTATGIVAGISQVPRAIGNLSGLFSRLSGVVQGNTASVDQYNITLDESIAANESYGGSLEDTSLSLNEVGNDLGTTTGGLLNYSRATGVAQTSGAKFAQGIGLISALVGAAAVAIGIISTNTFGARDAINSFGESVGNALPPLQGVLVAVQNLAVDIGLAGDDAKATVTDFRSLEEVLVDMGTGFEDLGAKMEQSASAMESKTGTAVKNLGSTVRSEGPKITSEVEGWGAAFDKFGQALAEKDWPTAIGLIGKAFESISTIAVSSIEIIGDAYAVGQATWIGTIQDFAFNAGNLLLEAGKQGAAQFVKSITDGIAGLEILIFGAGGFDRLVQLVTNTAQDLGDALNQTWTYVTDISDQIFTALGLPNLVEDAQVLAGQIAAELAKIKLPTLGPIGTEQPTTVPETASTAGQDRTAALRAETLKNVGKIFTQSATEAAAASSVYRAELDRTSLSLGSLDSANRATTANTLKAAGAFGEASKSASTFRPFISDVTASTGRLIDTTGQLGIENNRLSDTTKHLNNNFLAAMNTNQGFREAFVAAGGEVANLSGQWIGYAAGLQSANDAGVRINDTVLRSIPATAAFGDEIGKTAEKRQMDLGVASAWLAENAKEIDQRKLTGAEIIATAENLKKEQEAIEQERAARDSLTAGLKEEMADRLKMTQANFDTVASYTSSAFAASQSAEANAAIAETLDPLIEGQRIANEETRGIQQAYEALNPATLNQIIAYQKEAQALELGNILREGSNRATIALAQAQTAGVRSGVEFANSQFTAQASLQGYRAALSEAIAGNTEYGDSLGLTTQQLENQISFQNRVVEAQEEIINSVASQVDALEINRAAWDGMTEAQLANLDSSLNQREALVRLIDPLARTAENVTRLRTAFIDGIQASKDWVAGLQNARNEEQGFRDGLIAMVGDMIRTTNAFDPLIGKNTELFSKLDEGHSAFSQAEADMDALRLASGRTTEQLRQLTAVAQLAPDALRQLGSEIQSLANEFLSLMEFQGEEDELFGDFEVSDKLPKEIREMFSESTLEFAEGQAQMQRIAEQLGPAIGIHLSEAFQTMDLTSLSEFGPKAAAAIREGWDGALPPVLEQFVADLEAFGGMTGAITPEIAGQFATMAQGIIQDINNLSNPMDLAIQKLIEMGGTAAGTFDQLSQFNANVASMAGGLEAASHAGEDLTTKISDIPLVKLTDDAGNVVMTMANFNGQLIPIPGALNAVTGAINPMNAAIQAAGASMQQFATFVGDFFMTTLPGIIASHALLINPFEPMIAAAVASLDQFSLTVAEKFTILMNTLNTSAMAYGPLVATSFGTGFTTGLSTQLATMLATWITLMTTLNTSAMQYGTLTATSFGTSFATGISTSIMTVTTSWITLMTTLNTSALQYGTLAATSFGQGFATGMGTALALAAQMFANVMAQIQASVTSTPIVPVVNIAPAAAQLVVLVNTINSIKQTTPPPIQVNITPGAQQLASLQQLINGIKQGTPPPIQVNIAPGMQQVASLQNAINAIKQTNIPKLTVDISQGLANVRRLQSAINSLKGKNVTSTHTIRTVRVGAQHGFGPAVVDKPTPFMVGEHNKPELVTVTPLTNPNRISDRTIDLGRLAGAPTTRGLQKGGAVIAAPSGGISKDMMRELIEQVRDVNDSIRKMKLQPPPLIMDGKRVDEIQQIRRNRRIGDFA